uniref:Uncharacterized protein n=1 Tax=Arundo donax TaxID=35708 RepID=A0A0A9HG17_ARUDO
MFGLQSMFMDSVITARPVQISPFWIISGVSWRHFPLRASNHDQCFYNSFKSFAYMPW